MYLPKHTIFTFLLLDLSPIIDVGIDLTEIYMSVEWDILEVPAVRNVEFYTCCEETYLEIPFNMKKVTVFNLDFNRFDLFPLGTKDL